MKKNFIVIDIETTALKAMEGEIIEIGAIKVNGETYEVIEEFEKLIKVDFKLSDFTKQLTGITDELLAEKGEDKKTVLQALADFCGDLDCYAHYAPFEKEWFGWHLTYSNIEYIRTEWIDTIDVFTRHLPKLANRKLETYIKHYNLAEKEDHRAMSDAKHTLTLLKMVKDIREAKNNG